MPLPILPPPVTPDPSEYVPSKDYHPTNIIVRCFSCGSVGNAEFIGGFNLQAGDRLMKGRTIHGTCFRCKHQTEFVPISHLIGESEKKELALLYEMRKSLEELAKRGMSVPASGNLIPYGRLKAYEQFCESRATG